MTDLEILHGDFDPVVHSKHFCYYCEVIILPDGKIVYAVPSHQEKVISLYSEKHGVSVDDLKARWYNELGFLDMITKDLSCILIWYDHYSIESNCVTSAQLNSLFDLVSNHCIDSQVFTDIQKKFCNAV